MSASVEELLEKGVNLYKNEEFEFAEKALVEALEKDPKNLDVLNFLGLTNIHMEEFRKAQVYFDQALEINPNDEIVWNNKGDAYGLVEEAEKAIECFEKAISINPEYGNAYFNLGIVQSDIAAFDAAHKSLAKAIELNEGEEKVDAYYEQALIFIEEDKFEDALKNLDAAEELMESAELTNLRATCYDHLERYEEALKLFESIEAKAEEDELMADILFNKAFTLISLNREQDAVNALIKSVELFPEIKDDVLDNELLMELESNAEFKAVFGN